MGVENHNINLQHQFSNMTDEGNVTSPVLEMSETDKKQHLHFASCCPLTRSTYAVWQNLPLFARSSLSAFTADS